MNKQNDIITKVKNGRTITAEVNENGLFESVLSIDLDNDTFPQLTQEEIKELSNVPIEKKFSSVGLKEIRNKIVVDLIDEIKVTIEAKKLGKPNWVKQIHPISERYYFEEIKVGTGGCYSIGSDSYPCIVTKVSKSGKQITVEDVSSNVADGFEYYNNQVYNFDTTPIGNEQKAYHTKLGYRNKCLRFSFRGFHKYENPSL